MLNFPVVIGEKLLITRGWKSKKQCPMVSQVIGDCREGNFTIAMPMLRGKLVPLWAGGVIRVSFCRKNGIYEFRARIIGRKNGRIPSLKIRIIPPVTKSQRRDYYRLSIVLPVLIYIDCPTGDERKSVKCYALDLSAGGIKIASDREFERGCIVFCNMVLEDKLFSVRAKVIRSVAVYNREHAYETGLQFIDLNEKIRSKIIGFIFREQSKLKRKGLV